MLPGAAPAQRRGDSFEPHTAIRLGPQCPGLPGRTRLACAADSRARKFRVPFSSLHDLPTSNVPREVLAHCPASTAGLSITVMPIPSHAELRDDFHANPRIFVAQQGHGPLCVYDSGLRLPCLELESRSTDEQEGQQVPALPACLDGSLGNRQGFRYLSQGARQIAPCIRDERVLEAD